MKRWYLCVIAVAWVLVGATSDASAIVEKQCDSLKCDSGDIVQEVGRAHFSVSPASVMRSVSAGETISESVVVSNVSGVDMVFETHTSGNISSSTNTVNIDGVAYEADGELADWITFSSSGRSTRPPSALKAGESTTVLFQIDIPADAKDGREVAYVIIAKEQDKSEGGAVQVSVRLAVPIYLTIGNPDSDVEEPEVEGDTDEAKEDDAEGASTEEVVGIVVSAVVLAGAAGWIFVLLRKNSKKV